MKMKMNFFSNPSQEVVYPRIVNTPGYPQGWIFPQFKKNQKVKVTDKVAWVAVNNNQCVGIVRQDIADTFTEYAWDQVYTEKLGTNSFWVTPNGKKFNRLKDAVNEIQTQYSC
jgi:hypothetical protein